MSKLLIALLVIGVGLGIGGAASAGWFSSGSESDKTEKERVEQQQQIYVNSQPIPAFDWSLERHIFIELYKARNNAVQTYSYVRNWQGQIIFSCESIGFPMPANTQLTNPDKLARDRIESVTIPQPEPNGLFTSPSNVGTYVFCINDDGSVSPSYFEAEIESHLSPLTPSGSRLQSDGTLKINVNQE